ncbi:hypothetical protein [Acinetobacter sp. YH01009]|uniref:hypothetical protein n=1 Tax=Acinetobacter sp. YH01009 TaxID=2601025 RepID=UPI0015D38088|nr:hypothetical protein [Acinetobacter sp. YH01009]
MMNLMLKEQFKKDAILIGFDTYEEDGEFVFAETELAFKLWMKQNEQLSKVSESLAKQNNAFEALSYKWSSCLKHNVDMHLSSCIAELNTTIESSFVVHQKVVLTCNTGYSNIDKIDSIFTIVEVKNDIQELLLKDQDGAIWSTSAKYVRKASLNEIQFNQRSK